MENNNTNRNKRIPETSIKQLDSSRKVKKLNFNQNILAATSSLVRDEGGFPKASSTDAINDKMTNIAKLRQQFIQEIKDVELSLKEAIKNLRQKISDANKKNDQMTIKLNEANQVLCNQAQNIYEKEQEYVALREKVEELYEYQKILIENMEDISKTLNSHKNLSRKLKGQLDCILRVLENCISNLNQKLLNIRPDENLFKEIENSNFQIAEMDQEILKIENELNQLEKLLKTAEIEEEKDEKIILEMDQKINELESSTKAITQEKNKENNDLHNEINKLVEEMSNLNEESHDCVSELKSKLEIYKNEENELEKKILEIDHEFEILLKEKEQLDETQYTVDQENSLLLEKSKEELKIAEDKLESVKQKENQAIGILNNKMTDYNDKLKHYDALKGKVEKYEREIKKEEELIVKIEKELEIKKLELTNKIQSINDKIMEVKKKKNQVDSEILKSNENINFLEKEVSELNQKLKAKSKRSNNSQQNSKQQPFTKSVSKYGLPKLFSSEATEMIEKPSNKSKKAYYHTPIMGDDDLEIDSLPIEEQLTKLTQSSNSSPVEKGKKFFKNLTPSQKSQKSKKETPSRGKGRGKKT